MSRRKFYIPKNEIYRAYDEHKSKNPGDYWFDSEFDDEGIQPEVKSWQQS